MVQESLFARLLELVKSKRTDFNPKEFSALLVQCKTKEIDVNETDGKGRNLLFYGIESGKNSCILIRLCLAGVKHNHRDNQGRSLLHWAARYGHLDAFKSFMVRGLDVHALDKNGKSPLDYCLEYGTLTNTPE